MKTNINLLEWDSNFFGYKVGSMILEEFKLDEFDELKQLVNEQHFKIVYCFPGSNEIAECLLKLNIPLVDNRVTYMKHLTSRTDGDFESIEIFQSDIIPDKLLKLAFDSGEFSRFKVDKNFKNNEFEKLYTVWLQKSITHELADEVLIIKEMNEIKGFGTYQISNGVMRLCLLAVDKNFRGKGYGKKLLLFQENLALMKNISRVEIIAQKANKVACSIYEAYGYKIIKDQPIFHLWTDL